MIMLHVPHYHNDAWNNIWVVDTRVLGGPFMGKEERGHMNDVMDIVDFGDWR